MRRKPGQIHILFVHNARTTFVADDLEMLQRHFHVEEWFVHSRICQKPISLFGALRRSNLLFIWFASLHAFLPVLFARILNIPIVVVTGGYDTANVPEADYGLQRGGIRKRVANFTLLRANQLLAISEAASHEICKISGIQSKKVTVAHCGVRMQPFTPAERKERLALTVGGVWRENLYRKGLMPFVQAASYLPEWTFILVGKWHDDAIDMLRKEAGTNVHFAGFVRDEVLSDYYSRASVYVQASLHEGFGLSVAEAMTAGCWPIVSNAGSLPEVVGEYGSVITQLGSDSLARSIKQSDKVDLKNRVLARAHIIEKFSLEARERMLVEVIKRINDTLKINGSTHIEF